MVAATEPDASQIYQEEDIEGGIKYLAAIPPS